jgi:hypothetical protein
MADNLFLTGVETFSPKGIKRQSCATTLDSEALGSSHFIQAIIKYELM